MLVCESKNMSKSHGDTSWCTDQAPVDVTKKAFVHEVLENLELQGLLAALSLGSI